MRKMDELRPLTAGRLLALWRECRETEDPLERVLRCNGRILAECCFFRGERVYGGGWGSAALREEEGAKALSRAVQRDARRYDGGFSLY